MIDDETKELLLKEVEKNGNVSLSCAKVGVDKSTFYRWYENKIFKKKAEQAIKRGRETNCDFAESSLMVLIKQRKIEAIKYLLSHNSSRYKRSSMEHKFLYEKIVPPVVKQKTLDDLLWEDDRKVEEAQHKWDEEHKEESQHQSKELPTRIAPEGIHEIVIKEDAQEAIIEPQTQPDPPKPKEERRPRPRPHNELW